MKRIALIIAALLLGSISAFSAGTDSTAVAEKHHFIDTFKPMYLVSGFPMSEKIDANSSDIKFQLSFKATLFRDLWGKEFDFFVGYTQNSIWQFYAHSSPFYDNTYMPGAYISFPLKSKKTGNTYANILTGYEHRSNGRDDIYSRSINYAFVTYTHFLPHDITLQATARVGDSWYGDTHSMVLYTKYVGFLQLAANYTTPQKGLDVMVSVSPLFNRSIANATAEIGCRLGKKHNNPYLFVQYHYGYDESFRDCTTIEPDELTETGMLQYNGAAVSDARHMIRFGIMLHPGKATRSCL